jgi:hypothetical protein
MSSDALNVQMNCDSLITNTDTSQSYRLEDHP